MDEGAQRVLITGVSGNLGQRLLRQIGDFEVAGVDFRAPADTRVHFESMDLGDEGSCRELVRILLETGATSVVHLAFVLDPLRTGVQDRDRMWRINVAGTARVMEAIAVANRQGGKIRKFVFMSSVSAYGPELERPVQEDTRLGAHTLAYAIHKQECDDLVRLRAESLGECTTYVLRPHIYTGATMQNYMVGVLRGVPGGAGRIAAWMRRKRKRLPMMLPFGKEYPDKKFQFVHVDDVARLIAWILRRPETKHELVVLNVAGRGEPLAIAECARLAGAKLLRMPGQAACRAVLNVLWKMRVSDIPPDALPYLFGSYLMDTTRLQELLGKEYPDVIRHTVEEALADSFVTEVPEEMTESAASRS